MYVLCYITERVGLKQHKTLFVDLIKAKCGSTCVNPKIKSYYIKCENLIKQPRLYAFLVAIKPQRIVVYKVYKHCNRNANRKVVKD